MSIEADIITEIRNVLLNAGYKVFDCIHEYHTGFATKSGTYVMIDRAITVDWVEVTEETLESPFNLNLRYYQGKQKVSNKAGEIITVSEACSALEALLSNIRVNGMFSRISVRAMPTTATGLRGFARDYVLSGKLQKSL